MKLQRLNGTLLVTDLGNLNGSAAPTLIGEIIAQLSPDTETVQIDLAQTNIVDGYGLGALMSLYYEAHDTERQHGIAIRLLNPQPAVQQLLELTRMRHFFEIRSAAKLNEKIGPLAATHQHEPGSANVSSASFWCATRRHDGGAPRNSTLSSLDQATEIPQSQK